MKRVQKGLYMEEKNNRSVFLLANGRFVEGHPASSLSIGEEGEFYPLEKQNNLRWQPIYAPSIAFIAMIMLFFSALLPSEHTFAYIQLEMDSNIEFGVDEMNRVVSIRNLDEDSQQFIDKLGDWKGEDLDKLIARSIAISSEEAIKLMTITTTIDRSTETRELDLDQLVLKASTAAINQNVNIRLKKATFSQREKSIEENIPVGQKVEHFISIINGDKSKSINDAKTKADNYIKALKTKNIPSSSPVSDQVNKDPKLDKSNKVKQVEKSKVEKKELKPVEKEETLKKSNKTEKADAPPKADKLKSNVKTPKVNTEEKNKDTNKATSKTTNKATSKVITNETKNKQKLEVEIPSKKLPAEKASKNKTQLSSKAKKKDEKVKQKLPDTSIAQSPKKEKTATSKPRKPIKGEVRQNQIHQEKSDKTGIENSESDKKKEQE